MKIVKKQKTVMRKYITKPAHYKDNDTGNKKIIEIVGLDGNITQEERPIIEKVYVDAEFSEKSEKVDLWTVDDGVDEHEFLNEKDAKAFVGVK